MIRDTDPELAGILEKELERQRNTIELIASENFVPGEVLEAMGSVPTNKYAEGYPGKRYYGGNQHIDRIEQLAINRAKQLFGAEHANVQPLSGCPANLAVYLALLKPGDKILGMSLASGGHLSHGYKMSVSGKYYQGLSYDVDPETEMLDYDKILGQARQEKPEMIVCGASAYPRIINFKAFKEIADEVGAYCVADIAHIAGLVAAGLHPSPVPYCDAVTTTTHKTLRGPRSGLILCKQEHAKKIDKAVFPVLQGGPHEHTIAAKALCFKLAMQPDFKMYQAQVVKNAKAMADVFLDYGYRLVTGGTDNHLFLIDVAEKGLSGKQAQDALEQAGITVNKNMIPFDKRKPVDPSGIRIGTPAITTRGMKEENARHVAELMIRVLENIDNMEVIKKVASEVKELLSRYPLYPGLSY